jgi:tetratricopeptide (TPR) repeat protein
MTIPRTIARAALLCMALVQVALVAKLPSGAEPAPVAPKQTQPEPLAPDQQRIVDSQIARDKADRMRGDFEAHHKPGPAPQEANKQFNDIVEAFRAAIDIDPSGEVATYCRLRLSGAYTYTGDFNAALRILEEAVNAAVGIKDRVQACQEAANFCLQAMHKPADALRWFKRAEVLIPKIDDPNEQAKWLAANTEGTARCEKRIGKMIA